MGPKTTGRSLGQGAPPAPRLGAGGVDKYQVYVARWGSGIKFHLSIFEHHDPLKFYHTLSLPFYSFQSSSDRQGSGPNTNTGK